MFIAKFGGVINNFLVLIGSTQLEKKKKKKNMSNQLLSKTRFVHDASLEMKNSGILIDY